MALPRVIVIVGPTASGKTALAIEFARQYNGQLISADSRQVYRGMDIGTAKSSAPQYLVSIRNPNQTHTLSEWQHDAYASIDELLANNQLPIVVGGTMLYIDSLLFNYYLPAIAPQPEIRRALEAKPIEILYEELLQHDPPAKQFIEPKNKRRIIRALEVIATTGQPFSAQRKQHPPRYDFLVIGLFPGWEELKKRIAVRAQQMLDEGLLDEIKRLRSAYGLDLPLLQTMNYRENGDIEKMVTSNLRYAHRQMSWWRKNKDIRWFKNPEEAMKQVLP